MQFYTYVNLAVLIVCKNCELMAVFADL